MLSFSWKFGDGSIPFNTNQPGVHHRYRDSQPGSCKMFGAKSYFVDSIFSKLWLLAGPAGSSIQKCVEVVPVRCPPCSTSTSRSLKWLKNHHSLTLMSVMTLLSFGNTPAIFLQVHPFYLLYPFVMTTNHLDVTCSRALGWFLGSNGS